MVERSLAWLVSYRRVQVRYERRADILLGFLSLAGALICIKALRRPKEGMLPAIGTTRGGMPWLE